MKIVAVTKQYATTPILENQGGPMSLIELIFLHGKVMPTVSSCYTIDKHPSVEDVKGLRVDDVENPAGTCRCLCSSMGDVLGLLRSLVSVEWSH